MDAELFALLEKKVDHVLGRCRTLQDENLRLREEVAGLRKEREEVRARVDEILGKIEGIELP